MVVPRQLRRGEAVLSSIMLCVEARTAEPDFTTAEVSQAVPSEERLAHARASLVTSLPETGLGFEHIKKHLLTDIAPAFTGSSRCPNYYAYTTGAVTDAALYADWIASTYDQNVQVHLPNESIATTLESTTLRSDPIINMQNPERLSDCFSSFYQSAKQIFLVGYSRPVRQRRICWAWHWAENLWWRKPVVEWDYRFWQV